MKVLWSWLAELVDLDGVEVERAALALTMSGTTVEQVERVGGVPAGVRVALALAVRPHPNADRLRLVDLRTGEGDITVVCGAPNVAAGQRVGFAAPGVTLPGGLTLEKRSIRGVESAGMICSARELGLGDDAAGILVLNGEPDLGTELGALFPDDVVLHLEVTSNRPDCLGHRGVARELAAVLRRELTRRSEVDWTVTTDGGFPVTVTEATRCARYIGWRFRGVRVGPSPDWLRRRLTLLGHRSISNVVDVTNHVMLELGQPLHAFDHARLEGGRLEVRLARPGERLLCLDGQERELVESDLVIADAARPVALAGVMGGMDSAVTEATSDLVLEAATFDAPGTRAASHRHALRTESSLRFEKGLQPALAAAAAARAGQLLLELAGAQPGECTDWGVTSMNPEIRLPLRRLGAVLGAEVEEPQALDALRRLGFDARAEAGVLVATAPPERGDVDIEEDLVEEIGRVVGYERVPARLPGRPQLDWRAAPEPDPVAEIEGLMNGAGYSEALTSTFVSTALLERVGLGADSSLALQNPLSANENAVRRTLLLGLFSALRHNLDRGAGRVRLFETGHIHGRRRGPGELPASELRLGAVAADPSAADAAGSEAQRLAGVVRELAATLHLELPVTVRPGWSAWAAPGCSVNVFLGEERIGAVGAVGPRILGAAGIEVPCAFLDLELEPLLKGSRRVYPVAPLPRHPAVRQDLAVTVPRGVPAGRLAAIALESGAPLVVEAVPFDEYAGDQVAPGHKSVALRLVFRAADRTLTEEEATAVRETVLRSLQQETGATLR
ncbi:MAG: phenylalanine--tRNA ligase subunit beta [Candidatus Dormibacteria bacterium]